MFCENIMTLIRWMYKSYSFFGLFNMYFFFFFPNHWFVLFFLIYKIANACTVFLRCTFTVPFCWATLSFFFFKFWTVATVPRGTVAIVTTVFFFFSFYFFFFFLIQGWIWWHVLRQWGLKGLWCVWPWGALRVHGLLQCGA